jgi:hypothetical protein
MGKLQVSWVMRRVREWVDKFAGIVNILETYDSLAFKLPHVGRALSSPSTIHALPRAAKDQNGFEPGRCASEAAG